MQIMHLLIKKDFNLLSFFDVFHFRERSYPEIISLKRKEIKKRHNQIYANDPTLKIRYINLQKTYFNATNAFASCIFLFKDLFTLIVRQHCIKVCNIKYL